MPSKNSGSGGARRVTKQNGGPDAAPAPHFSPKQLLAIELLASEPFKTQEQYAKELGVDRKTLLTWRKLKGFGEAVRDRAREIFGEDAPAWFSAASKRAREGDVAALKLCLQMIGEAESEAAQIHGPQVVMVRDRDFEPSGNGDDPEREAIKKRLER